MNLCVQNESSAVHLYLSHISFWVAGLLQPGPKAGNTWIGCQSIAGQSHTHTYRPRGNLACPVGLTASLWTAGGNSRRHRENMRTPHRKEPGYLARESDLVPSCGDATAPPTVPPWQSTLKTRNFRFKFKVVCTKVVCYSDTNRV